jgi:hypothetical protein
LAGTFSPAQGDADLEAPGLQPFATEVINRSLDALSKHPNFRREKSHANVRQ